MTLREAIDRLDDLKPNVYDDTHKARWISELDARIYNEVFKTHEGEYKEMKFPYVLEDASEINLLADFPHDEMYVSYLEAKIDQYNNDTTRYANSSTSFNNLYNEYTAWFNRTHMPIERGKHESADIPISPF